MVFLSLLYIIIDSNYWVGTGTVPRYHRADFMPFLSNENWSLSDPDPANNFGSDRIRIHNTASSRSIKCLNCSCVRYLPSKHSTIGKVLAWQSEGLGSKLLMCLSAIPYSQLVTSEPLDTVGPCPLLSWHRVKIALANMPPFCRVKQYIPVPNCLDLEKQ